MVANQRCVGKMRVEIIDFACPAFFILGIDINGTHDLGQLKQAGFWNLVI